MKTIISAEEIGAKLVEWYSCIIANDTEQANESKKIVDQMISDLPLNEEDYLQYGKTYPQYSKIKTHYNLISFRHKLKNEEIQKNKSAEDIAMLIEEAGATDGRLKYLYYFLTGQYEFYQERYKSSIRAYRLAEGLLDHIGTFEKAEFYSRIGFCYYRLDHYEFALSYMERSTNIYKEDSTFEERVFNNEMTRAYITTELNQFDKAEEIFQEVLSSSKLYPATYVMALRGIGLNRVRQGIFEEAKEYFIAALDLEYDSLVSTKNKYNLANVKFRLGENEEAKKLLDQAEEESIKYQLKEYTIRCLITRGLYQTKDMDSVEKGLEQLKENDLLFEYGEVLEEISQYFDKQNDFKNSLKYLKMAYINPTNLLLIN